RCHEIAELLEREGHREFLCNRSKNNISPLPTTRQQCLPALRRARRGSLSYSWRHRGEMIRTGEQYRESLRDDRAVWINGERVKDVTRPPSFKPIVDARARIYD